MAAKPRPGCNSSKLSPAAAAMHNRRSGNGGLMIACRSDPPRLAASICFDSPAPPLHVQGPLIGGLRICFNNTPRPKVDFDLK